MAAKLPLSVFIIALNEGDRIHHTINSVRDWVDEIIVIDSGSTDDTKNVSEAHGARFLHHDWPGYGLQKRFGEDQCRNPWVLNLDADEIVPASLRREIETLFARGTPEHEGYLIKIVEILPGEQAPRPGAHSITAIRLYDKSAGRFSDSSVHDTVRMERGSTASLEHIIEHRSVRSIAHSIEKINRYSTMQAENLAARGKRMGFLKLRLIFEFPWSFLKAYVLRRYFMKGWTGYQTAMLYAFSRYARVAKHAEQLKRDGKF